MGSGAGRGGGVHCHMSLSGRAFVPGPACLFRLSSEDGFTRRCLAQLADGASGAARCSLRRSRMSLRSLGSICEEQRQRFLKFINNLFPVRRASSQGG